jgi:hypothetical protein
MLRRHASQSHPRLKCKLSARGPVVDPLKKLQDRESYESTPSDSRSLRLSDLVVVCLGMRVNVLTGMKTVFGLGPKIEGSVAAQPDGLLLHENLFYSLFPPHVGMRQYWRDFDSLERWTRTEPHRESPRRIPKRTCNGKVRLCDFLLGRKDSLRSDRQKGWPSGQAAR